MQKSNKINNRHLQKIFFFLCFFWFFYSKNIFSIAYIFLFFIKTIKKIFFFTLFFDSFFFILFTFLLKSYAMLNMFLLSNFFFMHTIFLFFCKWRFLILFDFCMFQNMQNWRLPKPHFHKSLCFFFFLKVKTLKTLHTIFLNL